MTARSTCRVGILLFDDVEVLDFAGPYEVFTTAARMSARERAGAVPFDVRTVARGQRAVRARAGLVVQSDHGLADAPPIDLLVVPGGVVDGVLACAETLAWIAAVAPGCRTVASVCTGVFVLAAAGVLGDAPVTTHWEDIGALRTAWPSLVVREGVRWVQQGRVISSAGIAAGIDMSLHLVAQTAGRPLAERTARQLDVRWLDTP